MTTCLTLQALRSIVRIMKSQQNALGSLLFDGRSRKGFTLRQVETKTGISNAYLSQLEGGRRVKEPSPILLHKLGALYDLPYVTLLKAAGYPVPGSSDVDTSSSIAARLGPTTKDEEDALADYLSFLRSKSSRKGR